MFVKLFGTCSRPLTIMLNQGNLPIRQRLPQLESLVLQLVVPHRSSDEARQYLDNPGHDDAITRHHYKPLHAICFNVFAYQCRAPLYFAYQFSHEKCSQKLTHDQQSTAVWKKFKEIAPNRKDGSKAFRRFLGIVNKEAPKALPIEVDDWGLNVAKLFGQTLQCARYERTWSKAFWANPAGANLAPA